MGIGDGEGKRLIRFGGGRTGGAEMGNEEQWNDFTFIIVCVFLGRGWAGGRREGRGAGRKAGEGGQGGREKGGGGRKGGQGGGKMGRGWVVSRLKRSKMFR